jgi:hypothetical protein
MTLAEPEKGQSLPKRWSAKKTQATESSHEGFSRFMRDMGAGIPRLGGNSPDNSWRKPRAGFRAKLTSPSPGLQRAIV